MTTIKNRIKANNGTKIVLNMIRPYPPLYKGPKCRFIFIRMHKVGGTSLSHVFGTSKDHYTSKEAIARIGKFNWNRHFKFAFVRNPFAKVVSAYNYFSEQNRYDMGVNPISFEDWVKKTYGPDKDPKYYFSERWFQSQSDWLKDDKGVISIDVIGKCENLSEDCRKITEIVGIDAPVPHLNKSKKTDYRRYYNETTYNIVKDWHREDMERFAYAFDVL